MKTSSENKIKKHKLFWIWDFDKEEKWLNKMAQDGYVLENVGFCCRTMNTQRTLSCLKGFLHGETVLQADGECVGRLPAAACIRFKTLMLTYKVRNGPAPPHLMAMVKTHCVPQAF